MQLSIKVEYAENDTVERLKARLAAKGYAQKAALITMKLLHLWFVSSLNVFCCHFETKMICSSAVSGVHVDDMRSF